MHRHPFIRLFLVLALGLTAIGASIAPAAMPAQAAAAITLSRANAAPGDAVTVQGSGFRPGNNVVVSSTMRVRGSNQQVQVASTVDGNGNFIAVFRVPPGTAQGDYTLDAKDFSGNEATRTLTVAPLAYITTGAGPHAVYVVPGNLLFVSGQGFRPGEQVTVSATFAQYNGNAVQVQRAVQANGKGRFYELRFDIPNGVRTGTTPITATGNDSKRSGSDTLHIVYRPSLTVVDATVRPGTAVTVRGTGFVANTTVRVSLTLPRTGTTNVALSRDVTADGNGNFTTSLDLPSNAQTGRYTVTATDTTGGFRASDRVRVSVNPSVTLQPSTAVAGQTVVVSGGNFGSNAVLKVSANFLLTNGRHRYEARTVRTNSAGGYAVRLFVPNNAANSTVVVRAESANGRASATLTVRRKPAPQPTSTPPPAATSTPTNAPTATPTLIPTQPSGGKKPSLGFRWISIWYHTLRVGTVQHIRIQSRVHTRQGIWVNVWFPGGHFVFFKQTDGNGYWGTQFYVPRRMNTNRNHDVLVTFRLWHGKHNVKNYMHFKLVW